MQFTFPTLLFATNDTTLFGEEQGCQPTFDEQSNTLEWKAQVGQCGQTYEKVGYVKSFQIELFNENELTLTFYLMLNDFIKVINILIV